MTTEELRKKYREFCESHADCSSCKYKDDCSELMFSYDRGIVDEMPKAFDKGYYSGYQQGRLDEQDRILSIFRDIRRQSVQSKEVEKDLKKQKPTDLTNKCGSCKWATERHKSYIDCTCPNKSPNWFARTRPKCKFYELKEQKK